MLLYAHRDHRDYEGGEPRTSTSTFKQRDFRFSVVLGPQKPSGSIVKFLKALYKFPLYIYLGTATSTFTQLLCSEH